MERCVQDLGVKVQSIQWIERLWRSRCADTAAQNECTGIGKVTPYLLFAGEADWDDHVTGVALITAKQDIGLNKFFLPRAPSSQIVKIWEALSTAQPDSCLVYVTCSDARNAACEAPSAYPTVRTTVRLRQNVDITARALVLLRTGGSN
jgi:hypothetical protein